MNFILCVFFLSSNYYQLHSVEQINERLNAIEYIQANTDFSRQIGEVFGRLPDLPRLTSRATSSRTILPSFLRLLDGFSALAEMYAALFDNIEPPAAVCLHRITVVGKHLPDLRVLLSKFQFDRDKARADAGITPLKGEVPEFDAAERKARRELSVCS